MIDCDVHNTWETVETLRPYIAPAFREWFDRGEVPGTRPAFPAAHRPWLHPEDYKRADAAPRTGANAGSGSVLIGGATTLAAASRYVGGTEILAGQTLTLAAAQAAGSGAIGFADGAGELAIGRGDVPANVIAGFSQGDAIDLIGVGTAASVSLGAGNVLTVNAPGGAVALTLDPAADYAADTFRGVAAEAVGDEGSHGDEQRDRAAIGHVRSSR